VKFRLFLFAALTSCGGHSDSPARDSVAAPIAIAPPASAAHDVSGCPHTGRWAICSLETRLRQAGFVAKRVSSDSTKSAQFSVKPIVYTLGRARLEVYLYDDSTLLAREIAAMDTVGPPLVIRSGNLAAVYVGDNGQQAERLALAITAGAPQPGSPR